MKTTQLNYLGRFFAEANRLNHSSFADCRDGFQRLRFYFIQNHSHWSHLVDKDKDLKIWVNFDCPSYILYSSNPEFVKNVVAQETVTIAYAVNRTDPYKQVMRLILKKINVVLQQMGVLMNIIILKKLQHRFRLQSSYGNWEWIDLIRYFPLSPKHYQQLVL